ncbi:MAG: N-acyl-D-amino-acid deacylase [Verrucomicrobiales bacterium]|jgi:N-acyl-D-amino-acid deacylase
MKRSCVCLLLGALASFATAQDFDLILRNGRIVDGTGNPWFVGDVAIRGNEIAAIERRIEGTAKRDVDVSGLVVAPGFVDIHSHSDWLLLEDGNAQGKIRQGVTTEILGEGPSAGPFKGKVSPRVTISGDNRFEIRRLADYFDAVEKSGVSVNVASYVGLDSVWRCVMGSSHDQPSASDIESMRNLVEEAMNDGALGLSCQLMAPPGFLAKTDHVVALCEVVAEHDGIFSTHIRNEGNGVFESVKQAIEIGERAGVPVDIIHLKIADQEFWSRMNEVVALFEAARARGVNVQANVYPYTRGNNNLSSIVPPWAHEGGRIRLLERLQNPDTRQKMKADIRRGSDGWYNHFTAVGSDWSRMLVSANNKFRGQTMDKVMAERVQGRDPVPDLLDELFDFLLENKGSVSTVYAHHTEEDMTFALQQPWCSVGSDGSAYAVAGELRRGNPHPRNFGTFPRLLGRYVRDQQLLTLEDGIRKITSLNAAKIGLDRRGLLKTGHFADITIFDAETIIDKATFTDPFHYNEGIVYVFVNGELVLDHDKHTNARPGRALRRNPVSQ